MHRWLENLELVRTGSKQSELSPHEVIDRLKLTMASGNFEIVEQGAGKVRFLHGTYLTESAPLLPKVGEINVSATDGGSIINYRIEVRGFAKYWMLFCAVVFCWLVFPTIAIYRALTHHPDQLMKNLLNVV